MGLRKLREESKETREKLEKEYCKYLLVGDDFASVLMFYHLQTKYPQETTKILSEHKIDLAKLPFCGPTDLRGEENVQLVQKLHPEMQILPIDQKSMFFKDSKFKEFGGRSKSETILPGEEFFLDSGYDYDLNQLLPSTSGEEQLLFDNNVVHLIKEIRRFDDQNDEIVWEVLCTDGICYQCQHLFIGVTPDRFLNLLGHKDDFSNEVHEFCLSARTQPALFISFKDEKSLTDLRGTIYIPQSYTHEWGHFIGEFKEDSFSFFFLINEDEESEEISRKIRLLKRMLDKIFPKFNGATSEDNISVYNRIPVLEETDLLYDVCHEELVNLHFLGIAAPLSKSFFEENGVDFTSEKISYFARALASFHQERRYF